MINPPAQPDDSLEVARRAAIGEFRRQRMEEPLEAYAEAFDESMGVVEELLEASVDLTQLQNNLSDIVGDPRLLEALRHVSGPPVSADDLKTLADARSLSPASLKANRQVANSVLETILLGLDRRRFPWVMEGREATETERHAAVLATAASMATRRVGTARRHEGKAEQELMVEAALLESGLQKVDTRTVGTYSQAPSVGEFCRESLFGNRKADFLIRLGDERIMPLECKVSNSATNSVKRLNNDAAAKAQVWVADFGSLNVVPSAVLSGVYKLRNLKDAQDRGLALFWAHDLGSLMDWIESTRP